MDGPFCDTTARFELFFRHMHGGRRRTEGQTDVEVKIVIKMIILPTLNLMSISLHSLHYVLL